MHPPWFVYGTPFGFAPVPYDMALMCDERAGRPYVYVVSATSYVCYLSATCSRRLSGRLLDRQILTILCALGCARRQMAWAIKAARQSGVPAE